MSTDLDPQGQRLLAWLVGRLEDATAGDPSTYPSYKDAHEALGLPMLGDTYGRSLQQQGLTSLNVWTARQRKPAITGIIINRETYMPGGEYFDSYGKTKNDFKWWEEQVRLAKAFDWAPYLPPRAASGGTGPAIVRPAPPVNVEDKELTDEEIDEALRANRLRFGSVPTDSQPAMVRQRKGQARIRRLTVENYRGSCAVCDVTDSALLVASHVVGWAEDPEHRGDLANVICLCRMHDALFEAGYWSLANNLELVKRKDVRSGTIRDLLEGMSSFRVPLKYPPGPRFVERHRERVGLSLDRG
jgi:hypothetical protein